MIYSIPLLTRTDAQTCSRTFTHIQTHTPKLHHHNLSQKITSERTLHILKGLFLLNPLDFSLTPCCWMVFLIVQTSRFVCFSKSIC